MNLLKRAIAYLKANPLVTGIIVATAVLTVVISGFGWYVHAQKGRSSTGSGQMVIAGYGNKQSTAAAVQGTQAADSKDKGGSSTAKGGSSASGGSSGGSSSPSGPTLPTDIPSYPNASNTGVPAGTSLTPSGSIDVTVDGTVIDSLEITGCITVHANNVTIKNSRLKVSSCAGYETNAIYNYGTGLVVQDTEIDGQNDASCGYAIGMSDFTALRVNIHNCASGVRLSRGNITIQDSYIHGLSTLPGDENDAIRCYYGAGPALGPDNPTSIVHNYIEGGRNAGIKIADYCGGTYTISNNLITGVSSMVTAVELTSGSINFTSNRVVTGGWTPVKGGATILSWSSNYLAAASGAATGFLNQP